MKVFIYSVAILLLLACSVRKSSRYQSSSKDALALSVQANLRDSSSLSEIIHELDHVNATLYQISVISQQPFQWYPDSGLRLDGGHLVISKLKQNRQRKKIMDQKEQRVVSIDQQLGMERKRSEQKEVIERRWWSGFKWIVGGVLVMLGLGWWWVRRI